jgi:MHS family proline/betaine transporter-like MFS transporter
LWRKQEQIHDGVLQYVGRVWKVSGDPKLIALAFTLLEFSYDFNFADALVINLMSCVLSALGSITYYVGITYVPVFLDATGTMPETRALSISVFAALTVILVTPLIGLASDRFGRRPMLLMLALGGMVLPTSMFAVMASGGAATWVAAIVMAALGGAVSAVGAVATAEQFPGEGRLSGLALGATTATAIFGGLTPLVAHLLVKNSGWAAAPGAMIACVALCVIIVFWRMPETAPAHAGRDGFGARPAPGNQGSE